MNSHTVLVLGAGQIGLPVATLLAEQNYKVHIADLGEVNIIGDNYPWKIIHNAVDLSNADNVKKIAKNIDGLEAIVSCLPYFCNKAVVDVALELDLHYFDLSEDIGVSEYIKEKSTNSSKAFVPQCGLAPGFVSIVAKHIMDEFDSLEEVNLRVGALPRYVNNDLKYALTWSTNGLINECGNLCKVIENGKIAWLQPLEGYEHVKLDNELYECFTTSGGVGTLLEDYVGKVKTMNYKTMRYNGHRDLFKFLMFDLKLNDDRKTLSRILENAIPSVKDDVVIVYINVIGRINNKLVQRSLVNKVYATEELTAIQSTTAAGICGVVDIVLNNQDDYNGFVKVEQIGYDKFINNKFGQIYKGAVI